MGSERINSKINIKNNQAKMIVKNPMFKKKILIIDYGVGNHLSIINTLKHLRYNFLVSNKIKDIKEADCYILPGVGAFNEAMKNLNQLGIISTLQNEVLIKKKPLLGICLGMQILVDSSEEKGYHQGLGFIPGKVIKIEEEKELKVPHVGWNCLNVKNHYPLFSKNIKSNNFKPHFYFDHSYQVKCEKRFVSATCNYSYEIIAAIQNENIFGVQFHPEKSQINGFKLYRGFLDYVSTVN